MNSLPSNFSRNVLYVVFSEISRHLTSKDILNFAESLNSNISPKLNLHCDKITVTSTSDCIRLEKFAIYPLELTVAEVCASDKNRALWDLINDYEEKPKQEVAIKTRLQILRQLRMHKFSIQSMFDTKLLPCVKSMIVRKCLSFVSNDNVNVECTNLQNLTLSGHFFPGWLPGDEYIDLQGLPHLRKVKIENNCVKKIINFSPSIHFKELVIDKDSYNKPYDSSDGCIDGLFDEEKVHNALETLVLSCEFVQRINTVRAPNLKNLTIKNAKVKIPMLEYSNFPQLETLIFARCCHQSNNWFTNIEHLQNIKYLNLSIPDIVNVFVMRKIILLKNSLEHLYLSGCRVLVDIDLLSNLTKLKKLDLNNMFIPNTAIFPVSLKELNLIDAGLETGVADLIQLKHIEKVKFTFCNVRSLLLDSTNIVSLILENNNIEKLDFLQGTPKLKTFRLNHNGRLNYDQLEYFKHLDQLEEVMIKDCHLNNLDFLVNCKKLKKLSVPYNEITSINCLASCKNLEDLEASTNMLDGAVDLSNCLNLTHIDLLNNPLKSIKLHKENTPKKIYLSSSIDDFSFLSHLNASEIKISSIHHMDIKITGA